MGCCGLDRVVWPCVRLHCIAPWRCIVLGWVVVRRVALRSVKLWCGA